YIPELDDYELKPHYDFDYSKSKPNPFVTRPNSASSGKKRESANGKSGQKSTKRKAKTTTVQRHTITLHQADAAYLHKLDKSLSQAIRKLILMQRKVS